MSFKYELLKKLVVAAGIKKRWLSVTTEELLEDRRKQNAKNRIPALKDDAFEFSRIDVMGFPVLKLIHREHTDRALGSSLGITFVGQLIMRQKAHIDHGIFGSPDLDQSGKFSAWLQSKLVVPLLTSFTGSEKKQAKTREKLKSFFEMSDETADRFMGCFSKFRPESIRNEYYTDLLTHLEDDIHVEHTLVHFIYAKKMGEKYLKRYRKYFRDPEIREFDMQHEQWLFGGERYTIPVLKAIDEFMETPV